MDKQLDTLLLNFPDGNASEAALLEFAKQAGLDEKELDDLKESFNVIDKTTERMGRLEEHRREGGTLESFVDLELEEITRNLNDDQKEIVNEAFEKAAEVAKSNALGED